MLLALFKHSLRCCFICYNLLIYFIYLSPSLSLILSPSLYMQHCKVPFHFALPDCCIYLKFVAVAAFLISPQPFHARPPACIYPFIYLWYLHTHTQAIRMQIKLYTIYAACVSVTRFHFHWRLSEAHKAVFFFFWPNLCLLLPPIG